ncbi:hypothetical protein F4703DRAFT_1946755 [Phycomyces blakesleeanus]
MSIPRIPFELLYYISGFLELHDLSQAGLVCREWNTAFMEVLWDDVRICSTTDAHGFYSTLTCHTAGLRNYRKDTSRLTLHPNATDAIPKASKANIFHLLKDQTRSHKNIGIIGALKSSLKLAWETFQIFGPSRSIKPLTTDQALFILCHLPHLVHLDIASGNRINTMRFTWKDIDVLHQCLQKLETLKLGVKLDRISPQDNTMISRIDRAPKLLTLEFTSKEVDLGWLYYWENKYPNLRAITWINKRGIDTSLNLPHNEQTDTGRLMSSFRYLDTINLNYRDGHGRMTHVLLDKLHELNSPIKNISCSIKIRICDLTDGAETTDKIMMFSKTLKKLNLEIQGRSQDKLAISQALCHCPFLVDLKITAPYMTFSINHLLDNFPSLKSLNLFVRSVDIEPSRPFVTGCHGLRTFKMCNTHTVYRLFSYISRRCRRLKFLHLHGVMIPSKSGEVNNIIPIKMKYSCLDTFQMENMRFSFRANCQIYDDCEAAVLFRVLQHNPLVPGRQKNAVAWYRKYFSPGTKIVTSEWESIAEAEGDSNCKEFSDIKNEKRIILAGYVSLECGSVKNILI